MSDGRTLGVYRPFMPPGHAVALAGQRYVVLRPVGTVAAAYDSLRTELTDLVGSLDVTGPLVGHITLAGISAEASLIDMNAVVDEWARTATAVPLRILRVTCFPPPFQIVVAEMERTPQLVSGFSTLNSRLRAAGIPSLIQRPLDEWTFHMSMLYCTSVPAERWPTVVAGASRLSPLSHAAEVVETADVALFDANGAESDGGVRVLGATAP